MIAGLVNGGESRAVLIVICGGAFGFNLEGIETFRGCIIPPPVGAAL